MFINLSSRIVVRLKLSTSEFSFLVISTFIWFIAFIVSAALNKYGSGAIAAAS
ncbi:uncharacterized protein DEA37_0008713 [Paragonimus westermani]|uniref:MARVEL domain-containing protein n=1 Tax=Paragonimus westermani TaxID=34504 RepID=A0A5J4N974_9TREM|nr:uncharacterized protein DEA37_0008713 [Paragonimus westermani]